MLVSLRGAFAYSPAVAEIRRIRPRIKYFPAVMAKVNITKGKERPAKKSPARKRLIRKTAPTAEELKAAMMSMTSIADIVDAIQQARSSSAKELLTSQNAESTPLLEETFTPSPEVSILEQEFSSSSVKEITDKVKLLRLTDCVSLPQLAEAAKDELQEPQQYENSQRKEPTDAECGWSAGTEPALAYRPYMTISQSALKKTMLCEWRMVPPKIEAICVKKKSMKVCYI
ncbi:hypothetical protein BX666DRAFT_487041 [Dichotomocladium elegans]|nr:hypothetical protein BX666DRAFT_487041 [Dichotomocladium elegans]